VDGAFGPYPSQNPCDQTDLEAGRCPSGRAVLPAARQSRRAPWPKRPHSGGNRSTPRM
jgi:hypothetical protein